MNIMQIISFAKKSFCKALSMLELIEKEQIQNKYFNKL